MAEGPIFESSDVGNNFEENTARNKEAQRTDNINPVKYLTITNKGKLRWSGSFEKLEILINTILETQVNCSSPGGYCKQLETDGLEIRWYSNNYSLIIKGEQCEEMKSQLREMAELAADKEIESTDMLLSQGNGDREGSDISIDNPTFPCSAEISSSEASNYDKVLDSIRDLEQRFTNKFDELLHEIRQPSKAAEETLREDRNILVKENNKLRQEINILSDKINDYKCITSDLNMKVKELEDEKKSLITAIKIVQNDQNMDKESTWNIAKNRKPNQNKNTARGQHSGENNHNRSIKTSNQYSVLIDNESEDEIQLLSQTQLPKNRNQFNSLNHTHMPNQDKDSTYAKQPATNSHAKQKANNDCSEVNNNKRAQVPHKSPRVGQSKFVVLGDSMLKYIDARRIQQGMKQKIAVKTFPGAGVNEMYHYVKPTLLTTPSKLFLHVGTKACRENLPMNC